MSYNIFSYGIYLNRVEKIIGSKNQELFDEIQDTETFELYADQDQSGSITTKDALEQLIFGKPYHDYSVHSYWYAFIAICEHEGEALSGTHEINLGYETDLINGFLKNDFGIHLNIEETLLNQQPITRLPKVLDWPLHGVLYQPTLLSLQQQFKDIHIADEQLEALLEDDEEKEMAYDSIRQIKRNVDFCLDNGMELISFCH